MNRLRRPPPSHSRLSSPALARLVRLLALGGFASIKTILNRFYLATLADARRSSSNLFEIKTKRTPKGVLFVLAEKERFELSRRLPGLHP